MAASWAGKQTATQLTSVSTEQFFDVTPTQQPNERTRLHIKATRTGSTDNLIVALYSTLDESTPEWATVPDVEFTLQGGTSIIAQFTVYEGTYKWRVGVRRSGTTDTFTVDLSYRVATLN